MSYVSQQGGREIYVRKIRATTTVPPAYPPHRKGYRDCHRGQTSALVYAYLLLQGNRKRSRAPEFFNPWRNDVARTLQTHAHTAFFATRYESGGRKWRKGEGGKKPLEKMWEKEGGSSTLIFISLCREGKEATNGILIPLLCRRGAKSIYYVPSASSGFPYVFVVIIILVRRKKKKWLLAPHFLFIFRRGFLAVPDCRCSDRAQGFPDFPK